MITWKWSGIVLGVLVATTSWSTIKSGADKIVDAVSPTANIGIEVVDLNTGSVLYERNARQYFIPASNMKLFSDAAALMVLGPDYKFKNQLSTNASRLQNGVLKGSLYLHLPGDPSFSHKELQSLFAALKKWGVTRIEGNVVIDSGHAVVSPYPPGWMTSDYVYAYGAPAAPLMIDANRVSVTANPGYSAGAKALVELQDHSEGSGIILNNQATTALSDTNCKGVGFSMDNQNLVTVRGCVVRGQWSVQQYMAIRNPLLYAKGLIKKQLANLEIQFDGDIVLGKTPKGSLIIATESSKAIAQLMADTLKPSDNLYADSLFLYAAATLKGSPVNWKEAEVLIKDFLQHQTGIDLQNAVLVDGSGLSRHDLLTPHQTVALLKFLHDKFPVAYEYIAALPVSGRDGTLQKRFKTPTQQDLMRAKTGTMAGVHSLSGYLYTANGHTLAFAIYGNRKPGSKGDGAGKHRYLIDALCNYFLKQEPGNIGWSQVFSPHARLKFQQNPTQADMHRSRQASWRRLESAVKQALLGKTVTVIYRGNELFLEDHHMDSANVWLALQNVRKKYPFAIAVMADKSPASDERSQVLWVHDANKRNERVWMIKDAAG